MYQAIDTKLNRQARSSLASRFPHPCEALGFGELVRVHLLSGAITAVYRGVPQRTRGVRRRKVQPHVREHVVLRHGSSIAVHEPEAVACSRQAPPSRPSIPSHSFHVVLRDAEAIAIEEPEVELCHRMPLLRRQLPPSRDLETVR